MFAAPADLAQRLKQAIKAAKLSPELLAEYSVYYPQHEDEVLRAFKELEQLTDTPDVEAFVKTVLKAASVVPPAAGAAGSSAAAAAAAGTNNSGPPYPFKLVVKQRLPGWDVSATSSGTTSSRQLPRQRRFVSWRIYAERNEIMDFVQQECGDHTYDKPLYTVEEDMILSSEAMCNTEFNNAFCVPAVRMVRKMRPGLRLISSINPAGAPVQGLPDFVFTNMDEPAEQVLVGEGKTPAVMRCSCTIFAVSGEAAKQKLHQCIEQEANYMFLRGHTYGFLTYANGTFFIKRTGDLEFAVTNALRPNSGDPTVMEMLIYVLLKQIDEGEWELKNKAINPRLLAIEDDKEKKPLKRQQHMPPPQTRSKRASGGNTQQTCSQKPKRSKRGCQLEVTRNVLGRGQTGDVLAGRVHNKEVAVKSVDLYKQTELVEMLQHEVVVLKHLAPLQGPTGIVPELVEEGFIEGMDVFCIATGIVSGEHPSSSLRAAFPAAQEALAAIHSKGVLHGDIRRENVLVLKVEDAWKVCFIDFGQSTFSSDPALQAAEMKELQLLFWHSEDGSTNR